MWQGSNSMKTSEMYLVLFPVPFNKGGDGIQTKVLRKCEPFVFKLD